MSAPLTTPALLATEIAIAARRPGAARTLLLDLDGTLAPIAATPEAAAVPARTLGALSRLVELGWSVGIVSGRPAGEVASMVPVAGVRVFGGHGSEEHAGEALLADPSAGADATLSRLAEAARQFASETPGARVEVKRSGIAFHDRQVPHAHLEAWRRRIRELLDGEGLHGFEVLQGRRVVEVRLSGVHKGTVLRRVAKGRDDGELDASLVAVGDDLTDEDLFKELAGRGLTVIVGQRARATAANRRLSSSAAVRELLEELIARSQAR